MVAPGEPHSTEFRLLGAVEVLVDGQPRALEGTRQRALLAMLLLHANEVVSTSRLIEALWGEQAPPTAAKTLQAHMSRLRRDLELPSDDGPGPRLVTRAPGYVLRLEPGQLDLARFEAAAASGRAALDAGDATGAAEILGDALALWRGPALADLALEPVADEWVPRLEDQRVAVVEDRIDADLARGRAGELIPELSREIRAHPLRERLRAQLMLALYRSGRQADALSAFQDARRTFVAELGLEPGPRLQDLERGILEQDPELLLEAGPRPRQVRPPQRRRGRLMAGAALAAVAGAAALVAVLGGDGAPKRAAAPEQPFRALGNTLVRIDARTGEIRQVARVGRSPDQVVVVRGNAWVANFEDRTVSHVELETGRAETIRGLPGTSSLTTDPQGGVYVSSFERYVWEIPERTLRPKRIVTLRGQAEALAFGAGSLWITSPSSERGQGSDQVVRYDAVKARITQRIPVGATPIFVAFGFGRVWASNYDGDSLSVIEPGRAKARTVPVGGGPLGIAAGEGGIWVVLYREQQLWRLDPVTMEVVARIPVGAGPLSVAATDGWVWVTNREVGTVLQIDPRTNRVKRTIDVGLAPHGVAAADGAAWVTVRSEPYGP